jgi:hypothetical protein
VTHEEEIAAYAHRVIRLRDGMIESDTKTSWLTIFDLWFLIYDCFACSSKALGCWFLIFDFGIWNLKNWIFYENIY